MFSSEPKVIMHLIFNIRDFVARIYFCVMIRSVLELYMRVLDIDEKIILLDDALLTVFHKLMNPQTTIYQPLIQNFDYLFVIKRKYFSVCMHALSDKIIIIVIRSKCEVKISNVFINC